MLSFFNIRVQSFYRRDVRVRLPRELEKGGCIRSARERSHPQRMRKSGDFRLVQILMETWFGYRLRSSTTSLI